MPPNAVEHSAGHGRSTRLAGSCFCFPWRAHRLGATHGGGGCMTRARMPRPHEVAAARRDPRLLRALRRTRRRPDLAGPRRMPDRRSGSLLSRSERAGRRRGGAVPHLRRPGRLPGLGARGRRLPRGLGRHHAAGAARHAGRLARGRPGRRRRRPRSAGRLRSLPAIASVQRPALTRRRRAVDARRRIGGGGRRCQRRRRRPTDKGRAPRSCWRAAPGAPPGCSCSATAPAAASTPSTSSPSAMPRWASAWSWPG